MMAFFYRLANSINKKLNGSLYDDFHIEVNDDKKSTNLITKNGGYLSVIDFKGAFDVMDDDATLNFISEFIRRLRGDLKSSGRMLEFCILHDPSQAKQRVSQSVDRVKDTARFVKVNAGGFYDEKSEVLSDITSLYRCYLVVYTSPEILGASRGEVIERDLKNKARKRQIYRLGEHTPGIGVGVSEVADAHNAFMSSLSHSMSKIINFDVLEWKESLRAIRQMMFIGDTSDDWSVSLPGDKIRVNNKKSTPVPTDLSDVMNPSLAAQFFSVQPIRDRENSSLVDIDGTKYAPVAVEYGPEDVMSFGSIAHALKSEIPYRINISIITGHDATLKMLSRKNAVGSYISLFNSSNSSIKQSVADLITIGAEEPLCSMSIAACTWGGNREDCVRNKRVLMQALTNWGGLGAVEERGDPIGLMAESVGGFMSYERKQGYRFPMPVSEALFMSPLTIPSSPWSTGSLLFKTDYGSVYPFSVGTSLQNSALNLVFAPPGYGKSFLLSAFNMAYLLKPGNKSLPILSILDIGYSSAVFVRLVKSMLPDNLKYLAQAVKLQNTKEYSINIFDTMLGCRYPTSLERLQTEDVLIEVLSSTERENFEGLSEMVKLMVEKIYSLRADAGEPFEYGPGQNPEVTETLSKHSIQVYDGMTWWHVVDELMAKADYPMAKVAQRYASPRLSDLSSVLTQDAFTDYKQYKTNGADAVTRMKNAIKIAARDFPIISSVTQFDISDARIVSLDLQDVVPRSDREYSKEANVMYSVAKIATTKSFYMGKEALDEVNPKYRAYHAKVFDEMDSVQKHLCVDEYHRTRSAIRFRSGLVRDGREGRKFDIIITALSQYYDDFDDDLVRASTNKFILSVGDDADERAAIKSKFAISDAAMEMAIDKCHGPTKDGSNILYIGKIKGKGQVQQILQYVAGKRERWGYNTNKKDDRLAAKLIEKVGVSKAYDILSEEFPGGTAVPYLDAQAQSPETANISVDIITYVADKLVVDNYRAAK